LVPQFCLKSIGAEIQNGSPTSAWNFLAAVCGWFGSHNFLLMLPHLAQQLVATSSIEQLHPVQLLGKGYAKPGRWRSEVPNRQRQ
jgi:hypothetical protein